MRVNTGPRGRINKLVLVNPLSRHRIQVSEDAVKLTNNIREKHLETLKEIYRTGFNNPNGYQEKILPEKIANILDRAEDKFGGLQFMIDEYMRLKTQQGHDLLKESELDYSKPFFIALRKLRMYGWLRDGDLQRQQQYIGVVVARELACEMAIPNVKTVIDGQTISYCRTVDAINKLASLGFPSKGDFGSPTDADRPFENTRDKKIETLREIYENRFFGDLSNDQKIMILEKVQKVLDRVDTRFGGLTALIQKYQELTGASERRGGAREEEPSSPSALEGESLDYPLEFFEALLRLPDIDQLRLLRESVAVERYERYHDIIIGKEVACKIAQEIEYNNELSQMIPNAVTRPPFRPPLLCDAVQQLLESPETSSQRVYNVVSTYDGINLRFLQEWLGSNLHIRGALRRSAGEVHFERCGRWWSWRRCRNETNQQVEKIGINESETMTIKPWDPAHSSHQVPTLILAGDADPVTAGGQPVMFPLCRTEGR